MLGHFQMTAQVGSTTLGDGQRHGRVLGAGFAYARPCVRAPTDASVARPHGRAGGENARKTGSKEEEKKKRKLGLGLGN